MTALAEADLVAGVHFAWVDEDIVVLDLRTDAYILITGASALLQPVRNGGGVCGAAAVVDDLVTAGLAARTNRLWRTPLTPAVSDIRLPGDAPPLAALSALAHALAATAAFKRQNLAALVETARRRRSFARRQDLAEAVREAGAFEAVRPWVPFEGDCLQRSWMLHDRLCNRGVDAAWVFGVRTWPFFAHCWVQVRDVVVGDTLNRVGGFTPIMAV